MSIFQTLPRVRNRICYPWLWSKELSTGFPNCNAPGLLVARSEHNILVEFRWTLLSALRLELSKVAIPSGPGHRLICSHVAFCVKELFGKKYQEYAAQARDIGKRNRHFPQHDYVLHLFNQDQDTGHKDVMAVLDTAIGRMQTNG